VHAGSGIRIPKVRQQTRGASGFPKVAGYVPLGPPLVIL